MIPMAVSPPAKVPPIAAASANIPNILCSSYYGHIILYRVLQNPCKDLCFKKIFAVHDNNGAVCSLDNTTRAMCSLNYKNRQI